MRKYSATAGKNSALIVIAGMACALATGSYAASDEDAVKAAVVAYDSAVDALDAAKMEALWAHDDTVMDIEPGGKSVAIGWDAVRKNIEGFFPAFAEVNNVTAEGPHVQVKGDVARSITINSVTWKLKNGAAGKGGVVLTDVFEKRGGAWLLVSHSVASVPQ